MIKMLRETLIPGFAALCLTGLVACGGGDAAKPAANNANKPATNAAPANTAPANTAPAMSAADTDLKNKVEANLKAANITGVTVTVADGRVTIAGDVPADKFQAAVKAAQEANPPKGVDNKLNKK